jgi:hypothetical protein
LLTVYLRPVLPEGQHDDPERAHDEILGELTISVAHDGPKGERTTSTTTIRVIPCGTSNCDLCEATEKTL